jgi:DNA-directed RNA polymerase specialized sigma24 family protein
MQRASSFDETVLAQLPRIRAIGRGMLPKSVDLDDFVQDVVVRVYLKRHQLRDEERPTSSQPQSRPPNCAPSHMASYCVGVSL